MNKTAHTSQLLNQVRNFSNSCDEFLGEYYQSLDLFNTYQSLHSRLNRHRSFEEMKVYLNFNGKQLIKKAPWISSDQLDGFLDSFVNFYLNDNDYDILKEGQDQDVALGELEHSLGIDSVTIYSIKTALNSIPTLDYEGKDTLKRVLFKENIFNDKDFIKLLDSRSYSDFTPYSTKILLKFLYTIVEDCVYPHYHFIDESDVREIIFQLAFELSHSTGFFSLRNKYTVIRGRKNKKRCFSLINNYPDLDSIIKIYNNKGELSGYHGIFENCDLRLFYDNYGESQIDLKEALRKHFISYDIYIVEKSRPKRTLKRFKLADILNKNLKTK